MSCFEKRDVFECSLRGEYILQEAEVMFALLVLYI